MTAARHAAAPDQRARDAAVAERTRNVVIDAGAGTGKTSIVVARLLEMVAPSDDAALALPMRRVAAITFTRRAAGELRLRVRQALLRELSGADLSSLRRSRLSEALSELDVAYVGTIHSFADRLLRMRPMQARVSPAYTIAEDTDELVHETFVRLMHGAERGALEEQLIGTSAACYARVAEAALLDAQRVGIRRETLEREFNSLFGLDSLVQSFIDTRDVAVAIPEPGPIDLPALRQSMQSLIVAARGTDPGSTAGARLCALCEGFEALSSEDDPVRIYSELVALMERHGRTGDDWTKKVGFGGDAVGFGAAKLYREGPTSVRATLLGTLGAWLGPRLMHLRPVAIALYEQVKRRHQLTDQIDMLIKLRDLLRDDLESRGFYQQLFDHVLVDEFQDTDPLQAEIVMYLCERSPQASDWSLVRLSPGKLTIVGDPKQSIYRFRRADVEMYDRTRSHIANNSAGGALEVELEANFRSRAPLIEWFNGCYDRVLGASPDGRRFEPDKGIVYNHHLAPGRVEHNEACVHVVPFDTASGEGNAEEYRALEAEVMAHYLEWLVERSGTQITDPLRNNLRPVGYGDIAVLCLVTTNLDLLFPQLDALDLPYTARGSTLFLRDPLHQRFLLALRALADRDDGIAEAVLLRPPFFAIDPLDLLVERGAPKDETPKDPSDPVARVRAARAMVASLRRNRFAQPPGATARDLLENTALGRTVALGPNGLQRLGRLRELCLVVAERAAEQGLDYDAVTAQLRDFIDHPIQLDPPHPVGQNALQIMTVHQAKGLEFPVVVVWDGRALWSDIERTIPFRTARDGSAWSMSLQYLDCEVPRGAGLKSREGEYRLAERKRLIYVLGTRTCDLLVVPRPGNSAPKHICETLISNAPLGSQRMLTAYGATDGDAWWVSSPHAFSALAPETPDLAARFEQAARAALKARLSPLSVSGYAHGVESDATDDISDAISGTTGDDGSPTADAEPVRNLKARTGRYGSTFGSTVHRALELVLLGHQPSARSALDRARVETGLAEHDAEALADIKRTLAVLDKERLLRIHGRTAAVEYPITGQAPEGWMLVGIIDFLSSDGVTVDVIDFKTDEPPAMDVVVSHPEYVRQVRCYAQLLADAGQPVGRMGLLFTAEDRVRWFSE